VPIVKVDGSVDSIDELEERVFAERLTGEEAAAAYLYLIEPDADTKIPKPIVGPSADFVIQAVRRINAASRGRIQLVASPEPPVVQDFVREGKPWVRVTVGAIDKATGEISFGIKEAPARDRNTVTNLHTRAIRRAFEIHPSYNRKRVAIVVKNFLRTVGLDPAGFLVAGDTGSSKWAALFAQARAKGVAPDQVRAAVRVQTGKGLSEVRTTQEAAAAADAATRTSASASPPGGAGPARSPTVAPPAPPATDQAAGIPDPEREPLLHKVHDCLIALDTPASVVHQSLAMQFGVEDVALLSAAQLRTFYDQLQKRLAAKPR
jgi:hypothetical protein